MSTFYGGPQLNGVLSYTGLIDPTDGVVLVLDVAPQSWVKAKFNIHFPNLGTLLVYINSTTFTTLEYQTNNYAPIVIDLTLREGDKLYFRAPGSTVISYHAGIEYYKLP